jgi:hypothetical protein
MTDDVGNRFTWFSSSSVLEINTKVILKGTIKEHKEFKGQKQTVLSRCQELDEMPAPKVPGKRGRKSKKDKEAEVNAAVGWAFEPVVFSPNEDM